MKIINSTISVILVTLTFVSCSKDYLDAETNDYVTDSQVQDYLNKSGKNQLAALKAFEAGAYLRMKDPDNGETVRNLALELMGDNIAPGSADALLNARAPYDYIVRLTESSRNLEFWNYHYKIISDVNLALKFLKASEKQDSIEFVPIRSRLRTLRAYSHFRLASTYQHTYQNGAEALGIPIYDEDGAVDQSRGTLKKVYDFILADLEYAYTNIGDYDRSGKQEINKDVISGIYARVLLETGTNYAKCAQLAEEARGSASIMDETKYLEEGFSKVDNPEWIWGAERENEGFSAFFSSFGEINPDYQLNCDQRLYDAIPETDYRKKLFDNDNNLRGSKFWDIDTDDEDGDSADFVYMRASEMYLIQAEALAKDGNDAQAAQVLYELVSQRDPDYEMTSATGQGLLDEIFFQRKVELWGEGFALPDLKRFHMPMIRDYTGTNHVESDVEPSDQLILNFATDSHKFIFQLPIDELEVNPNISTNDQNER